MRGAHVVVALLKVAGGDADVRAADGEPAVLADHAAHGCGEAAAIRSGDVDAGVPGPHVLADPTGHRPREVAAPALHGLGRCGGARDDAARLLRLLRRKWKRRKDGVLDE